MIVQGKQEAKGTVSTGSRQEEHILNLSGSEQGPTEPLIPCKESIPDLTSGEESPNKLEQYPKHSPNTTDRSDAKEAASSSLFSKEYLDDQCRRRNRRNRKNRKNRRVGRKGIKKRKGIRSKYVQALEGSSSRHPSTAFTGNMRGGADPNIQDLEEQLMIAIQGAETPLMLDKPTLGDGNCWSRATVQQCQRAPIKLYLQSRGLTITNFMQLKALIYQFVKTNSQTGKIIDMKTNFDLSQLNMHEEDLPSRSWAEYWADMQTSGPWADDTFIQATAWFLRVDLRIIYVERDDMTFRGITTIAGDFEPSAQEERPILYYAYLVDYHYQSLLPVDETPANLQCLAQPAIDKTLEATLEALKQQKLRQGEQVGLLLKKRFYFYMSGKASSTAGFKLQRGLTYV